MRAPSVIEVGQLVFMIAAGIGLFMLAGLAWFLLIVGIAGLALFWAIERQHLASAPPTESDGA